MFETGRILLAFVRRIESRFRFVKRTAVVVLTDCVLRVKGDLNCLSVNFC